VARERGPVAGAACGGVDRDAAHEGVRAVGAQLVTRAVDDAAVGSTFQPEAHGRRVQPGRGQVGSAQEPDEVGDVVGAHGHELEGEAEGEIERLGTGGAHAARPWHAPARWGLGRPGARMARSGPWPVSRRAKGPGAAVGARAPRDRSRIEKPAPRRLP
jgi:hypothetical protein